MFNAADRRKHGTQARLFNGFLDKVRFAAHLY